MRRPGRAHARECVTHRPAVVEVKQGGRADRRGLRHGLGVLHDPLGQTLHGFSLRVMNRAIDITSSSSERRSRSPRMPRNRSPPLRVDDAQWAVSGLASLSNSMRFDGASGERCGGCVCHATGGGVQQLAYRTGYL